MSRTPEKRLRLRRKDDNDKGVGKLSAATAKYLQIDDKFEVVVAGKKKMELKAIPLPDIPENEVWVNTEEMRALGLADNSIATIRKA
ncbi:MAG: hypothetical protein QFX35_02295 [Candidatus Verstraetearchaeota archaeon]|nr:hypothetical protein [Candidatus Verstraetearchaeota archaeon]